MTGAVASSDVNHQQFPLAAKIMLWLLVVMVILLVVVLFASSPHLDEAVSLERARITPLPKEFASTTSRVHCDEFNCSTSSVLTSGPSVDTNLVAIAHHLKTRGWRAELKRRTSGSKSIDECKTLRDGFRFSRVDLGVGPLDRYLYARGVNGVSSTKILSEYGMTPDDLEPGQLYLSLLTGEGICQRV